MVVLPFYALSETSYVFTTDLKLGQTSPDIKQLQIILNSDLRTRIATYGPGSPGQETSYFGSLTKAAVIRFQNNYASEILIPNGLSYGTGIVGPSTRKKLNKSTVPDEGSVTYRPIGSQNTAIQGQNQLLGGQNQSAVINATGPRLYSVFPYQARPGDSITINGEGITQNTTVSFGTAVAKVSSVNSSGTTAQVTIPSNIGYSDYSLSMSNGGSSSVNQGFAVHLIVSANPQPAPVVSSVSPTVITTLDTPITVTGSGFTQNNAIYTGFGNISGLVSTNGTSFTFTPSQLPQLAQLQAVLRSRQTGLLLYIDFYVMNENGMTQKVSRFNVQ
jgi:peptidoglycan hydrolase-like protein with peptidoglycan-binding domain